MFSSSNLPFRESLVEKTLIAAGFQTPVAAYIVCCNWGACNKSELVAAYKFAAKSDLLQRAFRCTLQQVPKNWQNFGLVAAYKYMYAAKDSTFCSVHLFVRCNKSEFLRNFFPLLQRTTYMYAAKKHFWRENSNFVQGYLECLAPNIETCQNNNRITQPV